MGRTSIFLGALILILLMHGCFRNGIASESLSYNNADFIGSEKLYLYNLFLDEYLWYDKVPLNVDLNNYTNRNEVIQSLRYSPFDRWSFALSKEEYDALINQKTFGFGFSFTSDLKVIETRIGSPSYQKLLRGDKIVTLNGAPATVSDIYNASTNLGVSADFGVLRDGSEVNVTLIPAYYDYNVTLAQTFVYDGNKIGYLRYDEFTLKSIYEIEDAFDTFSSEQIDTLVIDLRYNGGGALALVSILLDNILGRNDGSLQFKLTWNDKNQDKNSDFRFGDFNKTKGAKVGNELSVDKVYLLVTRDSASASEALILALNAFLGEENVILIGSRTHGKGVGMMGRLYPPSQYYYFLINFYIKNNLDETVPLEGFEVDCDASDDIDHQRGSTQETMLKSTLYFMQYGECTNRSFRVYGTPVEGTIYQDNNRSKKAWMIAD